MTRVGGHDAAERERPGWAVRHGPWLVLLAPLLPQMIGSVYNIWYNLLHTAPLLEKSRLQQAFAHITVIYNAVGYPLAVGIWAWAALSLRRPIRRLLRGAPVSPASLARARRRAINLPWWGLGVSAPVWLLCIPVFLLSLRAASDPAHPPEAALYWHLSVSFVISALVACTLAFFVVELASQRLLFPVLFRDARPASTPGALALGLRGRMLLWALAGGVSPLVSMMLLILAPHAEHDRSFAL